jgi:hypothetical protein
MRKAAIHAAPNDVLFRNNSVRVELRHRFNVAYQDRGKNETFIIDLPGAFECSIKYFICQSFTDPTVV